MACVVVVARAALRHADDVAIRLLAVALVAAVVVHDNRLMLIKSERVGRACTSRRSCVFAARTRVSADLRAAWPNRQRDDDDDDDDDGGDGGDSDERGARLYARVYFQLHFVYRAICCCCCRCCYRYRCGCCSARSSSSSPYSLSSSTSSSVAALGVARACCQRQRASALAISTEQTKRNIARSHTRFFVLLRSSIAAFSERERATQRPSCYEWRRWTSFVKPGDAQCSCCCKSALQRGASVSVSAADECRAAAATASRRCVRVALGVRRSAGARSRARARARAYHALNLFLRAFKCENQTIRRVGSCSSNVAHGDAASSSIRRRVDSFVP